MYYSLEDVNVTENRLDALEKQNKIIRKRIDDFRNAGYLTKCRVCFQEVEGSSQCQGIRRSCSEYSNMKSPMWTGPFRDVTDWRPGGCTYQWRLLCR